MFRKKLTVVFLSVATGFVLYAAFSFYVASQIVAPRPTRINVSPTVISSDYENITVNGTDNAKLKGWLFKTNGNKLIIMVAGFGQNRINNDYYSVLIAKDLIGLGYNVLLYDNRATGVSGGKHVTLGIKESLDIIKVVDFARQKGFEDKNIGIIGDSLGAISLLLSSDQLRNVGAMVVDSPAANVKKVIENILKNQNNVPSIFNPAVFFILKNYYKIDVSSVQPGLHIKNEPGRVFLFLSGGLDTTIPPENSVILLKLANPQSKLVIFPNAEHVETYKSDPKLYRDAVFSFLSQNLGK